MGPEGILGIKRLSLLTVSAKERGRKEEEKATNRADSLVPLTWK